MPEYWVVVNQPTMRESHAWTTEDATDLILGMYDNHGPRWSFNPRPSGMPPASFSNVRPGDGLLLYNGSRPSDSPRSFLASGVVSKTTVIRGEALIELEMPRRFEVPVVLSDLWGADHPDVLAAEMQSLFRRYRHGPLDNLASHPGSGQLHPNRGLRRWKLVHDVAFGKIRI